MATKISFYLTQSAKYLNRSKLTILTLALAVSLVAGFGYYFDSAQNYILEESYSNVFDFNYSLEKPSDHDLSYILDSDTEHIKSTVMNSTLSPENSFYYRTAQSDLISILPNNTTIGTNLTKNVGIPIIWVFSPQNLYKSDRILDYIQLDSGSWPVSSSEIVMESSFAESYQYWISNNQSLKIRGGSYASDLISNDKLKIVGLYSFIRENEKLGDLEINSPQLKDTVFFSGANFENLASYPSEDFTEALLTNSQINSTENYGFELKTFLGVSYNRHHVNLAWLSSTAAKIASGFDRLNKKFSYPLSATDYLSQKLISQYKFQATIRLAAQLTNLPLLLFSIYLGSIANKAGAKKRYREFFTMRMRGFPKKMIRRQLLSESLINSIFVGFLGCALGVLIFLFGENFMNSLFLGDYNLTGNLLTPVFSATSIIMGFLFAGLLSFFSSLSTIKYINSLETSALSSEINNQGGEIDYDESNLYLNTSKSRRREQETSHELEIKNFTKSKTDEIPKWGLWLGFIGLIPILLLVVFLIGQNPGATDSLVEFSNAMQENIGILMIAVIISPFVFIVGFLRFLLIESPPRFAKIVRFLGYPFLKLRAYFAGIETVRQKQYFRIIMLTGIYITLLVFANITTNSMTIQSNYTENFQTGADVNFNFQVHNRHFSNMTDLSNFEQDLSNLSIDGEKKAIKNMTRVLVSHKLTSNHYINYFTLNLSEYLPIMNDNNHSVPNGKFNDKIQNVIQFNQGLDSDYVGVIVSQSFYLANNLRIGDNFDIMLSFGSETLTGKVLEIIDTMPGLYKDEYEGDQYIVLDNHIVNITDEIPAQYVSELINFHESTDISSSLLTSLIASTTDYYLPHFTIRTYNTHWDDIGVLTDELLGIPFMNLLYYNLIIIGGGLAIGIAILAISAQDENTGIYGELLARGFGRGKLYLMISTQVFITFLLSIVIGTISGSISAILFSKIFNFNSGGGFINYPITFDYTLFGIVLAVILGISFLFLSVRLYRHSRTEISEFLEDVSS
ncbi:MAG: FtsX-like permease family protein [Promethearchaeota archaeon]